MDAFSEIVPAIMTTEIGSKAAAMIIGYMNNKVYQWKGREGWWI